MFRIKASDIKEIDLQNFDNIKDINHSSSVYKYDVKAGIMYFNHVDCTNQ